MEKVLGNIATTAGSKFSKVKDAANLAKEQIACPNLPIHTHREKCLATVELALDTAHPKLSVLAVEALQLIVRDERFRSGDQTELSEQTLSMQLLNSLASLPAWNKGCQCHCLTIVVQLICSNEIKISLGAVQQALQLCMLTYGSSDEPSVRLAVRASITQMLNSFCSNLYAQAEEDSQDELAIFMDMTTLINDCVKKLDQLSRSTEQSVIVLEAIYSILSTQPLQILKYQPFNNAIWRDLCPCLMKLWGVPEKSSPCVVGRSRPSNDEPVGQGQIAGQFQSAARNIFETPDMARALYQILEQLVRLMATHEEMQSILQALFHKALLFPVVPQRLEALKVIKRIFGDQDRVIDLIRITVTNGSFIFWKLFLDCLVECSRCQTLDVTMEASRAADVLLESLEKMCSEMSGLPEDLKIKLLKMETFDNTVFHYEGNDLPDLKDKTPAAGSTSDSSDSEEEQMKRGLYESKEVINQRLQRLKQGMQRVPSLDPDVPPAPRSHRTDSQMAEDESLSSRRFMEKLADHYAVWLELKSSIEVDEHIQQFAADFYKEFTDEQKKVFDKHSLQPNQFLNGDALYLTVYAALCVARYGRTVNKEWFVKQVVGCGCIVYVSESWLGLVYDDVSKKAFFSLEGKANCALFEALEDFCGVGAQMMSAEQKLAKIANRNHVCDESLAVRKWTKALLNSSWEGLIVVLSRFLLGKEKKKSKATNSKVIRGTQVSLHALQSLCRLLIQLDMGSRSGWIFEKLVENVCPLEELRVLSGIDDRSSSSWQMDRIDKWRVSKQDALSLEMVLDNAVDCGLASSTCWKHVIRCTEYLWELERYLFGSGGAEERKTSRWSLLGRDTSTQFNMVNLMSQSNEMLSPEEQPLCGLFESSGEENLDAVGTAKVLCVLIAKAEKFYEKVGKWLNLDSLCQFMKSLVLASENRLRNSNFNSKMTDPCTLINRIALIILKIASRPLVHLMKVWPTITNHFIEAACTRDQEQLTCAAISCLHDCQNALLIQEPNGFCFNQMLFVPLQTILCIDMSSEETQDQIVSALSSFVHLSSEKIGSGWRPLFGALKAIRTSPLNTLDNSDSIRDASHLSSVHATVLDVFSTFLDIRNPNILSLTMYECINCLLHYLQATALESEAADTNRIEAQDNALGESAFLNLQKIDHILQKFFSIEMAPVPALLHRLVLRERSGDCMDATLTLFDDVVPELSAVIADSDTAETDPSPLELDKKVEVPFPPFPWKELGLSQRCTAELYLSLIEGLTGVVVTCPRMLQSRIFQHISTTTTNLIGSKAGLEFGAYSLSALILPMLQKWLRREMLSDGWRDNTSNARNFKQAVGMFTEVVVDYVKADNENAWCNRILLDLFILLSECVSQPSEIIARLGCSCLKHLIVSAGGHFTETQWTIAVHSLWKTTCICLHPIRRLMYHFFVSSTDYNGDVGNVQIALRQDSTSGEAARIKIIAHQVFLLDSQQSVPDAELHSPDLFSQADRSVVFVLNLDKSGDASSEEHVVKLPFRDIVISLLSQQLILQLLASILISEPSNCIPSGTSSLLRSIIAEPEQLGSKLSRRSISTLFHCLDSSFQIAHEFDSRPGLKFLVQKVLNADVAANLYKQMVTAYTIKALVLYGLARRNNGDLNDRKKFGRSLEKLCAQLGKLEKSTAEDKIAVLMRETVPQEVDFVLKEVSATETEQVFRIVSKQEVDGSLEEYKRHKKQSLPPSHPIRANPFAGASAALQEEQKIIDEQQTKSRLKDADVRIAAFVEMVLASFELLQAEDDDTFKMLLPMFYTSIALANRNSANLRIRTFVSDFFEKLDGVYALCDK